MAGPNLPTNVTPSNRSIPQHADDHNVIHTMVNKFDTVTPIAGQTLAHDGTVFKPTTAVFNVQSFGMVGDAIQLDDISITSGSNQMTSPSANFTTADIGKVIGLAQAGTSGAALTTSPSGSLRTIASVIDSHNITFDDPLHGTALTTVVAARTCTASITRGSNTLTSADAAFTASDIGKSITVPGMTGDDIPQVRSRYGQTTASSAVLTLTYGGFTTADVGKYVRVTRAGSGGAPLVAKISTYTSATSVTLDTNATNAVVDCEVTILGTPRSVPVKITSVTNATTVVVQRLADFTVSSVSASITGGSAVYGTNNTTALTNALAAVPSGATLFHPAGFYLIANSSVTLNKPVTFAGDTAGVAGYHFASSTRFTAGSDGVQWRRMTLTSFPITNLQAWNGTATATYSGWRFDDCRFLNLLCTFSGPCVDFSGAIKTTGTGICKDLVVHRCEFTGTLGSGVVISGPIEIRLIEPYVHDLGTDSTSVGIKVQSGARAFIRGARVGRCSGDAMDLFDGHAVEVADARLILNGGTGCEIKWQANAGNYNNSERCKLRGFVTAHNWIGGLTVSAPYCSVVDLIASDNEGSGLSMSEGVVGNTGSTRHTSVTNADISGNATSGISLNALADYVRFTNVVTTNNCGYGVSNLSLNNIFVAVTALNNRQGGISHGSTAKYSQQSGCQTQDSNGQCLIDAAAVGILVNGYGEEAAGTGVSPTTANWPVGAQVKNTSDSTVWVRGLSAWTKVA